MKNRILNICLLFIITLSSCGLSSEGKMIETEATIVEIKTDDSFMKKPLKILVEFVDKNGQTQQGELPYDQMAFYKLNGKVDIQYSPDSPSEITKVDKERKQKMKVTYGLLLGTTVILLGALIGFIIARKQGKSYRFKPVFLLLVIVLFIIALIGSITGKPYDKIVPFIG